MWLSGISGGIFLVAGAYLVGLKTGKGILEQTTQKVLIAKQHELIFSDLLDIMQDSLNACSLDRDAKIVYPGDTMLRRTAETR